MMPASSRARSRAATWSCSCRRSPSAVTRPSSRRRSIGIISPFFTRFDGEVHHKARYARYPALLGIGVSEDRDPEEAQIFARLVDRNAINFHAPAHVVCLVSRDDSPQQMQMAIARAMTQLTAR